MQRHWKLAAGAVVAAAAVGTYLQWVHDWRPSCRNVPSAAEAARWLNSITKEGEPFTADYVACVTLVAVRGGPNSRRESRDRYPHPGIGAFPETRPAAADFAKLADLPRLTDVSVTFRDAPAGYADSLAEAIGRIKPLKGLRLEVNGLTDAGARRLGDLSDLLSLEMTEAALGAGIEAWSKLAKLQRLALWGGAVSADGVARFADLRAVTNFGISGTHLSGTLAPIARMPALRGLTLWRAGLDEEQLASLAGAPELRYLEISAAKLSAKTFAGLARLPHLTGLYLTGSEIAGGLELLAAASMLERLALSETKIDDATGAGLGALRSLTWISLSETAVGDRTAAALARLPALDILDLGQTAVTDDAVRALAKAPKLRILALNDTAVTDSGITALAQYPSLERISLQRTKTTEAGIAALKSAKPDLVVDAR